jgi:hypothetical protein
MEKAAEFFTAWTKSQSEFMEKWLKAQKDFVDKWMEATRNLPLTEKGPEAFDAWLKPQKEFLESWSQSQKEFLDKWTEGSKNFQKMVMDLYGIKEGSEAFKACTAWMSVISDSSKAFTDSMVNMQGAWKANVEKQVEMSKEMMKKFSEMFKQEKA